MGTSPRLLPLFPLPSVVLFPGVKMFLHIFEPRYRAMTTYAFEHEMELGLILPKPGWESDYEGCPPLHAVGCAGHIVQQERLADGRFNLVLIGHARYRILEEVAQQPFRLARVELVAPDEAAPEAPEAHAWETCVRMISLFSELTDTPALKEKWIEELAKGPFNPGLVADRIVASLPLPLGEKQEALELLGVKERMEKVIAFLRATLDQRQLVARMSRFRPSRLSLN
ncbi:MAG: LON peptidase substrate-binding domain-containing protein [Planctomycetes bacterium]|nr:LON peptidase substrate-binding domain-containing protein [Planctomycetota bacterium]